VTHDELTGTGTAPIHFTRRAPSMSMTDKPSSPEYPTTPEWNQSKVQGRYLAVSSSRLVPGRT